MKICSIEGCHGVVLARGFCKTHYSRYRKRGHPLAPRKKRVKERLETRFWSKVNKTSNELGCWLWESSINQGGYGAFHLNGKTVGAHKVSYTMTKGAIPEGMVVDHKYVSQGCPRHCVNPEHLRIVSHRQNAENLALNRKNNSSGYRNVHWNRATGKWRAEIKCEEGKKYGGEYLDITEAAKAAEVLRLKYHSINTI